MHDTPTSNSNSKTEKPLSPQDDNTFEADRKACRQMRLEMEIEDPTDQLADLHTLNGLAVYIENSSNSLAPFSSALARLMAISEEQSFVIYSAMRKLLQGIKEEKIEVYILDRPSVCPNSRAVTQTDSNGLCRIFLPTHTEVVMMFLCLREGGCAIAGDLNLSALQKAIDQDYRYWIVEHLAQFKEHDPNTPVIKKIMGKVFLESTSQPEKMIVKQLAGVLEAMLINIPLFRRFAPRTFQVAMRLFDERASNTDTAVVNDELFNMIKEKCYPAVFSALFYVENDRCQMLAEAAWENLSEQFEGMPTIVKHTYRLFLALAITKAIRIYVSEVELVSSYTREDDNEGYELFLTADTMHGMSCQLIRAMARILFPEPPVSISDTLFYDANSHKNPDLVIFLSSAFRTLRDVNAIENPREDLANLIEAMFEDSRATALHAPRAWKSADDYVKAQYTAIRASSEEPPSAEPEEIIEFRSSLTSSEDLSLGIEGENTGHNAVNVICELTYPVEIRNVSYKYVFGPGMYASSYQIAEEGLVLFSREPENMQKEIKADIERGSLFLFDDHDVENYGRWNYDLYLRRLIRLNPEASEIKSLKRSEPLDWDGCVININPFLANEPDFHTLKHEFKGHQCFFEENSAVEDDIAKRYNKKPDFCFDYKKTDPFFWKGNNVFNGERLFRSGLGACFWADAKDYYRNHNLSDCLIYALDKPDVIFTGPIQYFIKELSRWDLIKGEEIEVLAKQVVLTYLGGEEKEPLKALFSGLKQLYPNLDNYSFRSMIAMAATIARYEIGAYFRQVEHGHPNAASKIAPRTADLFSKLECAHFEIPWENYVALCNQLYSGIFSTRSEAELRASVQLTPSNKVKITRTNATTIRSSLSNSKTEKALSREEKERILQDEMKTCEPIFIEVSIDAPQGQASEFSELNGLTVHVQNTKSLTPFCSALTRLMAISEEQPLINQIMCKLLHGIKEGNIEIYILNKQTVCPGSRAVTLTHSNGLHRIFLPTHDEIVLMFLSLHEGVHAVTDDLDLRAFEKAVAQDLAHWLGIDATLDENAPQTKITRKIMGKIFLEPLRQLEDLTAEQLAGAFEVLLADPQLFKRVAPRIFDEIMRLFDERPEVKQALLQRVMLLSDNELQRGKHLTELFEQTFTSHQRTASKKPSDFRTQTIADEAIPDLQTEASLPPVSEFPVISMATSKTMIAAYHTILSPVISLHLNLSCEERRTKRAAITVLNIKPKDTVIIRASLSSSEDLPLGMGEALSLLEQLDQEPPCEGAENLIQISAPAPENQSSTIHASLTDAKVPSLTDEILDAVKAKCHGGQSIKAIVHVENDRAQQAMDEAWDLLIARKREASQIISKTLRLFFGLIQAKNNVSIYVVDTIFPGYTAVTRCYGDERYEIFLSIRDASDLTEDLIHEIGHVVYLEDASFQLFSVSLREKVLHAYQEYIKDRKRQGLPFPCTIFHNSQKYAKHAQATERFVNFLQAILRNEALVVKLAPEAHAAVLTYVEEKYATLSQEFSAIVTNSNEQRALVEAKVGKTGNQVQGWREKPKTINVTRATGNEDLGIEGITYRTQPSIKTNPAMPSVQATPMPDAEKITRTVFPHSQLKASDISAHPVNSDSLPFNALVTVVKTEHVGKERLGLSSQAEVIPIASASSSSSIHPSLTANLEGTGLSIVEEIHGTSAVSNWGHRGFPPFYPPSEGFTSFHGSMGERTLLIYEKSTGWTTIFKMSSSNTVADLHHFKQVYLESIEQWLTLTPERGTVYIFGWKETSTPHFSVSRPTANPSTLKTHHLIQQNIVKMPSVAPNMTRYAVKVLSTSATPVWRHTPIFAQIQTPFGNNTNYLVIPWRSAIHRSGRLGGLMHWGNVGRLSARTGIVFFDIALAAYCHHSLLEIKREQFPFDTSYSRHLTTAFEMVEYVIPGVGPALVLGDLSSKVRDITPEMLRYDPVNFIQILEAQELSPGAIAYLLKDYQHGGEESRAYLEASLHYLQIHPMTYLSHIVYQCNRTLLGLIRHSANFTVDAARLYDNLSRYDLPDVKEVIVTGSHGKPIMNGGDFMRLIQDDSIRLKYHRSLNGDIMYIDIQVAVTPEKYNPEDLLVHMTQWMTQLEIHAKAENCSGVQTAAKELMRYVPEEHQKEMLNTINGVISKHAKSQSRNRFEPVPFSLTKDEREYFVDELCNYPHLLLTDKRTIELLKRGLEDDSFGIWRNPYSKDPLGNLFWEEQGTTTDNFSQSEGRRRSFNSDETPHLSSVIYMPSNTSDSNKGTFIPETVAGLDADVSSSDEEWGAKNEREENDSKESDDGKKERDNKASPSSCPILYVPPPPPPRPYPHWTDNVRIDSFDESIGIVGNTKWGDIGAYVSPEALMIVITNPNPWVIAAAVAVIVTALIIQKYSIDHTIRVSKKLQAAIRHSNADTEITSKLLAGLQEKLKNGTSLEKVLEYIDNEVIPDLDHNISNEQRRAIEAKGYKNEEACKVHKTCESEYRAHRSEVLDLKENIEGEWFARKHQNNTLDQLSRVISETTLNEARITALQKLVINKIFQLWREGKDTEARRFFNSEANKLLGLSYEDLCFFFNHHDEKPEFWIKHWDSRPTKQNWHEYLMASMIINSIQKDTAQYQFEHAMTSLIALMKRKAEFELSGYAAYIIANCILEKEGSRAEALYKRYLENVDSTEKEPAPFQAINLESTTEQLLDQFKTILGKPTKNLNEEVNLEVLSVLLVKQILGGKDDEAAVWMSQLQDIIGKSVALKEKFNQSIVLNLASELANRGYNQQAGLMIQYWQDLLPQNPNEKLQEAKEDHYFAHQGQMVRLFLPELLGSFRLFLHGCEPAAWQKRSLFMMKIFDFFQGILPQAAPFAVQAYLLGNQKTVVQRGWIQVCQQLAKLNPFDKRFDPFNRDTNDPSVYCQGLLSYAKLSLQAVPYLPLKNKKQILKVGQEILKATSTLITAWQFKNALSKGAKNKPIAAMPLLMASLVTTGIEYYKQYKKSAKESEILSEDPADYLLPEVLMSVSQFAGNTAYVARLTGGLMNFTAGASALIFGATSVYNSFCKVTQQKATLEALDAARSNIAVYNEYLKLYGYDREINDYVKRISTPGAMCFLNNALAESQKNIELMLKEQFNGLTYDASQPQQANKARVVHLHQRVRAHYNKYKSDEVIKWSSLIPGSSPRINAEYQLPAHLVWELIVTFRLPIYYRQESLISSFREEYQRYVQAIYSSSYQDKAWYKKNWGKVEAQLNQTVGEALRRLYGAAKSTASEIRETYLAQLIFPYHFCKAAWHEYFTQEEIDWVDNELFQYGYSRHLSDVLQSETMKEALTLYQTSKTQLPKVLMLLADEKKQSKIYWSLMYEVLSSCALNKYSVRETDTLLWGLAVVAAMQLVSFTMSDDLETKLSKFINYARTAGLVPQETINDATDYLRGTERDKLKPKLASMLLNMSYTYNGEHYLPINVPEDNDCAFHVFGITRKKGIQSLIDHVKACQDHDEVMRFILEEMRIWKEVTYSENFSKNQAVVCAYLTKLAESSLWMPHNPKNYEEDEAKRKGYSVLDALAFVHKKNLIVYASNSSGELVLSTQNVFNDDFETIIALMTSTKGFCYKDNEFNHYIKLAKIPNDLLLKPEERVARGSSPSRGGFFTPKVELATSDKVMTPGLV